MDIEQVRQLANLYPAAALLVAAGVAAVGVATILDPTWLWLRRSLRADRDRAATHGSARWAEFDEVEDLGILHDGTSQMTLGDFRGQFVGAPIHALVCAPTGAGKGVGVVLPTLLSYRGSIVCNDPKGENLSKSARYREEIGQEVVPLDPWRKGQALCGRESYKINPLAYIDKDSPMVVTQAKQLMRTICGEAIEGGANSFFYSAAEELIVFFILYLVVTEEDESKKNLVEMRKLIFSGYDTYRKILNNAMEMTDVCRGELSTMACGINATAFGAGDESDDFSTTFKSVLGNVKNNLDFLADLQLQDFFSGNTYDLRTVQSEPTSVYIIVDPSKTAIAGVFTRICYGTILSSLLEVQAPDGLPAIFLIDELVKLGKFKLIAETISIIRSNGVRYLLIIQNMQQLQSCYGKDAEDIEANTQLVAFAPSTAEAQEGLSRRLGNQTINVFSEGEKGRKTKSKASKPLLSSEELARLDGETLLIFSRGCAPIRARLLKYYKDKRFAGRFDPLQH